MSSDPGPCGDCRHPYDAHRDTSPGIPECPCGCRGWVPTRTCSVCGALGSGRTMSFTIVRDDKRWACNDAHACQDRVIRA